MTEPSSKKHGSNGRDRLSELPDEVLVHILSFLPIEYAVRTVLLRRFGKLWTLTRNLTLSYSRKRMIDNVIEYHRSNTIDKFQFSADFHSQEEISNMVNFALRKKIRILSIYSDERSMILPPLVYRSQCLVSLDISYVAIELPHGVNMGSLRRLLLCHVFMSDETFKELVSGCPFLQELIVQFPEDFRKLHFTNPSIEKLELNLCVELHSPAAKTRVSLDCPNLKILHIEEVRLKILELIDVSSVREVIIGKCCRYLNVADHFNVLLEKFRNAKVFLLGYDYRFGGKKLIDLGYKAYLQLNPCGNEVLAFQRNFWKHLALRSEIRGSCLLDICRLLKKSQYLEKLIIYADVDFMCNCNNLLRELSLPCVLPQLKTVFIRDYLKPCQALLQLIEFLLKSAGELKKLVIVCTKKDELSSPMGLDFILQLLSFPRASRKARVVFA